MIRWTAVLLVMLGLCGPAMAQELPAGVSPGDRTAIQDVITRQLDAFRHDDATGAYGFAAPNIRQMFPSPDVFMEMVRRGYPPVYRPRQQEFSELALRDGHVVQEVELLGTDGRPVVAVYTMEPDGKGGWLIAGCALIPSVRVGA